MTRAKLKTLVCDERKYDTTQVKKNQQPHRCTGETLFGLLNLSLGAFDRSQKSMALINLNFLSAAAQKYHKPSIQLVLEIV
jgi:hypothetical protein